MTQFRAPLNGETHTFTLLSPDDLTFAEARAIETVSGQAVMTGKAEQTADFVQATFWVSMKRVEPTLPFKALDDMKISDFDVIEEPEGPDPREGEADSDLTSPDAA